MPKNKLNLLATIKSVDGEDNEDLKISGYASTKSADRVGDVILPEGWDVKNFLNNPILLFNHKYDKPIGKVTEINADENGLYITGIISKHAKDILGLVKDQVLRTFSVGFLSKDIDYNKDTGGYIIKAAELLEISVVSVPCNQDAVFSLAKSFENPNDFEEIKKQFAAEITPELGSHEEETPKNTGKIMDPEELKKLADALAQNVISQQTKANEEAAKAKALEEANKKAVEEAVNTVVTEKLTSSLSTVVTTVSEKLTEELETRFKNNDTTVEEKLAGLKTELLEHTEEVKNLLNSKRNFSERGGGDNAKTWQKEFAQDIDDAFMLARATGKGYDTEFAKSLMEKVNAHSTVQVSSQDFEQIVSTNIERDIQNELILAPMFRNVTVNAATTILPILPDAGYAEITANAVPSGSFPNGTLDERGVAHGTNGGIALNEVQLKAYKMVVRSYLGNETEEDAIMPVLPLIRESMIRSHARGVENLILFGNHADGVYNAVSGLEGLVKLASTNSRNLVDGAAGADLSDNVLTAAKLMTLRKNMGKYGIRPSDVVYIVSQRGYFELIEDPEFQDMNLVGAGASKLTGSVGNVYGSDVVMCDEFSAPANGKYFALAVNTRNFVQPILRGVTIESEYSVDKQHRVMVTSQRRGFKEIIEGAPSVFGLRYPAAS